MFSCVAPSGDERNMDMMKFRTSFQIGREPKGGEVEGRPSTALPSRIAMLREKPSRPSMSSHGNHDGSPVELTETYATKGLSRKASMLNMIQKTRTSLRATGSKLEQRIPRKNPSRVVKSPSPKRNSFGKPQPFDIDENILERMMGGPRQEKQASASFLDKQRTRAGMPKATQVDSRKQSIGISPMSSIKSQAELDRTPLSAADLESMFAGAPYFSVEQNKKSKAYRPKVSFKGDLKKVHEFPTDFQKLGDASFQAATLERTKSREVVERPLSNNHDTEAQPIKELYEVPSMLSARGQDPGTVGFEHFLQLPVSDANNHGDQSASVLDKRKLLHSDPEQLGLRDLEMETLINRLAELSELHTTVTKYEWESPAPWNRVQVEEMGEELFGTLLDADLGTTAAGTGDVTLKTQISALQKILNTDGLWRDFSQVEWRIRVGQSLWAGDDFDDTTQDESSQPSEREVLLLQITLAAELLMRLYALEALSWSFPPIVGLEDAEVLETERTGKIQWDLLLAERFLENMIISSKSPKDSNKKANRNSMMSMISFVTVKESPDEIESTVKPFLSPRNEAQQLAGLLYFAEILQWPHVQDVKTALEGKVERRPSKRPISVYLTPPSSPMLQSTTEVEDSFFDFSGEQKRSSGLKRTGTAQSMQLISARSNTSAADLDSFEVGGWLSRSWLSGLVLPGEAASHFLISALLENSPQAITALGEEANLYGGFLYEGCWFWSTSSVAGRVMAAGKGATQCMGWVSVPASSAHDDALKDTEDGWYAVDVKPVPAPAPEPRIKDTNAVERDSDPLHNQANTTVQAGDFTKPIDGPLVMGNEVKFHGLSFTPLTSATLTEIRLDDDDLDAKIDSEQPAKLTFSSPLNSRLPKVSIPLTYDVHFISSYPCHPRKLSAKLEHQSKPSVQLSFEEAQEAKKIAETAERVDSARPSNSKSASRASSRNIEKDLPSIPAHSLHIDYHFDSVPAATLLSLTPETRPRALSSPTERRLDSVVTPPPKDDEDVVVLDCRGSEDLELLARAWCAKVGENAVVGKSGRTCLSCCVREARACGVCVVIRT